MLYTLYTRLLTLIIMIHFYRQVHFTSTIIKIMTMFSIFYINMNTKI
jgi:hypothetical protein